MTSIDTDGALAAGSGAVTLRTCADRLAFAEALVPLRAFVPRPRTVTVRRTVWLASAFTVGRVQVGLAEFGFASLPPFTLQAYSGLPS